ncbi:MAG TPA: DNA cytosine methyltransferase [Thermomicrobiales bacterium]|nr:DNA cytosine methyltransferase [Thermomicrobiales bacterium]
MKDRSEVISLFCGAGGMSLGFSRAGLDLSVSADIDHDACQTYGDNLGVEPFELDLSIPDPEFDNELKLHSNALAIIGGPPCQGFSSAGRKDSQDPRNALIFSYLDIVERVMPRWFVFENVEGILTSNRGESIFDLVRELIRLGYSIRVEKVNFAAWGLPQARKRVLLIGNRIGLNFELPSAQFSFNAGKHQHLNGKPKAPSMLDALEGLGEATKSWDDISIYRCEMPLNEYDTRMREGNEHRFVRQHNVSRIPKAYKDAVPLLRPGQTMKDLPEEYWHVSFRRRAFRRVMDGTPTERRGGAPSGIKRLRGDLNSLTITSAATSEFIHPLYDRPLSVRESARLQSFPDRFIFSGNPKSAITQIGNAVPPLAAQTLAALILEVDGKAGTGAVTPVRPGLLGYRLTDAMGMSPALGKTDALLRSLLPERQFSLPI